MSDKDQQAQELARQEAIRKANEEQRIREQMQKQRQVDQQKFDEKWGTDEKK